MSSTTFVGKHSLKKMHSRNIETTSTSITSAPPTTSESKTLSDHCTKKKCSKELESSPDISNRKSRRNLRISNLELSSSANDFTLNGVGSVAKNQVPTLTNLDDADKVMHFIQTDSINQKQYKYVM